MPAISSEHLVLILVALIGSVGAVVLYNNFPDIADIASAIPPLV